MLSLAVEILSEAHGNAVLWYYLTAAVFLQRDTAVEAYKRRSEHERTKAIKLHYTGEKADISKITHTETG